MDFSCKQFQIFKSCKYQHICKILKYASKFKRKKTQIVSKLQSAELWALFIYLSYG